MLGWWNEVDGKREEKERGRSILSFDSVLSNKSIFVIHSEAPRVGYCSLPRPPLSVNMSRERVKVLERERERMEKRKGEEKGKI